MKGKNLAKKLGVTNNLYRQEEIMSVLRKLNAGEEAVITGFKEGVDSYRKKLLSMGLTKGTKVKLLKVAPMGDPIEIEVRGFKLSLRKGEADVLKIRSDKCSPKR